jgi:alcohol dehydrogenase (cytochrome c)
VLTSKYGSANWAEGLDHEGRPRRDPLKDSSIPGALVSPTNPGVTNWPPPAFSPDTGLFYVPSREAYAMYYLNEADPRKMMGLTGKDELAVGPARNHLAAIDYKTGKVAWQHTYPFNPAGASGSGGMGLLTTAGNLLFAGDISGNLVAYNAADGKILWHTHLGEVSNAPQTYMLDGHQYILVAGGDTLYAFTLY